MALSIIIVEDEEPARMLLEKYVEKVPNLQLAGLFTNAVEAGTYLAENSVDIMLLDIHMELLSGLDFLKSLKHPPATIFTTAYSEYALDGYELDVVDYLVKPITFDRFFRAISKAMAIASQRKGLSSPTGESVSTEEKEQALFLKTDQRIIKINYSDLLYFESYGEYVKVHTQDRMLLSSQTMSFFEDQLQGEAFFRIHRSYLVNLKKVTEIEGNQVRLPGHDLQVSKRQKETFLSALQQIGKIF